MIIYYPPVTDQVISDLDPDLTVQVITDPNRDVIGKKCRIRADPDPQHCSKRSHK